MYIMVNYQNSSIYKICCNDVSITDIYIGSTTNFTRRKQEHKKNINGDYCNMYLYKFIRDHGGWNNWNMILVEAYNATDKRNLETRERHFIETLKSFQQEHKKNIQMNIKTLILKEVKNGTKNIKNKEQQIVKYIEKKIKLK